MKIKKMPTHEIHDEGRGNVHGHALQHVLYLKPRVDLVHGQRLERVLERTHPLQPAEHLRNRVEVDEEARESHLVQARYRADEDREAAVRYGRAEEEILCTKKGRVSQKTDKKADGGRERKAYKERHGYRVKYKDE